MRRDKNYLAKEAKMSAKRLSIEEKMALTPQEYRLRARRGE